MARRRYDPSKDRKTLNSLLTEFNRIVRSFCDEHPLVRGNLQTLRRRCGKPRCRCTRGKLHETSVFVDRTGGERIIRKVLLGQAQKLSKPTRRYQALKNSRARMRKLLEEVLDCCDRLRDHRLREGRRFVP